MKRLRDILTRRRYATGGFVPAREPSDDIPAILSPCGYTTRRPGETWTQATERLLDPDEREPWPPAKA